MRTNVEMVTPSIAKNWLKRNKMNRAVRPSHVAALASAMKIGDFPLTHQGIAFDEQGNLLDGQHRLHAVIEANVPVQFNVTRDAPRATFPYLDDVAKRNTADKLNLDKRTSEVVGQLAKLLAGGSKPTPAQLQAAFSMIGQTSIRLNEACAGTSKVFSSSSMRLAAITSILMGEDEDYVLRVYRGLVYGNLQGLPPIAQSIAGQALRGIVNAMNKNDLIARGMKLFRKENANVAKVQVKDAAIEVENLRVFYRGLRRTA